MAHCAGRTQAALAMYEIHLTAMAKWWEIDMEVVCEPTFCIFTRENLWKTIENHLRVADVPHVEERISYMSWKDIYFPHSHNEVSLTCRSEFAILAILPRSSNWWAPLSLHALVNADCRCLKAG